MMLPKALSSVQLPSIGPIAPPPPGIGWIALTLCQAFFTVGRFQGEMKDPSPYSKFSTALVDAAVKNESILLTGRQGMMVAYLPALLVGFYYYWSSGQQNLAALLLTLHFAKRVGEVLFVHKYSGTMAIGMSLVIGTYYALDALMISSTSLWIQDVDPIFRQLSLALTVIGQVGNGYHHYLLASLRDNDGNKGTKDRYVAPRGGFFQYVAAPHYLFELVSWLGIACGAQQLNAFLEVLSHTGYLMGRSYHANEFYRKKFEPKEWPRTRQNIFPFVW